jgi:dTDP-4-dehydrorhamnose 3,5-epimerase
MRIESLPVAGPLLLTPGRFTDLRGTFSEVYNQERLDREVGPVRFVQDNHSLSVEAGTVRGLHFQVGQKPQAKLVWVVRGSILDVVVDIRRQSPTFGQHVSAILSAENGQQVWIPVGFAHGFCTLEPNTAVLYKVDQFWSPTDERGILWNDPALAIQWPRVAAKPVVHPKDLQLPTLANCNDLF